MAQFTHKVTGVVVSVADGKTLGSDWEPVGEKPKRRSKSDKLDG